jgi:site-specific recombinase XerD
MTSPGTLATTSATSTDLAAAELPLDQLAGRWLASLPSALTRAAYRSDFMAWLAFLDAHRVEVLAADRATGDAWRLDMEATANPHTGRPLSPATIGRRLSAVRSFYTYAEDLGLMARNPFGKVKAPKVSSDSPTLGLDKAEALAFLDAARAADPLTSALALTLLGLALRVSEALALDVTDLQTERGHTVARIVGKGGRRRTVVVPPYVSEALAAITAGRTSGPVFLTDTGEALDRHAAAYRVRKVARAAGITGRISPHSLRHAAATLSLDAGATVPEVQAFLGHADPKTTMRYDRARRALDGHAAYALAVHLAR